MGVVNNFEAKSVMSFGEIKEINLHVTNIILGIFKDCVCTELFFVISINFQSGNDVNFFLVNLEKHKSSIFYKRIYCY